LALQVRPHAMPSRAGDLLSSPPGPSSDQARGSLPARRRSRTASPSTSVTRRLRTVELWEASRGLREPFASLHGETCAMRP